MHADRFDSSRPASLPFSFPPRVSLSFAALIVKFTFFLVSQVPSLICSIFLTDCFSSFSTYDSFTSNLISSSSSSRLMEEEHETSSLRARRKKSSVGLTCCFSGHRRADSFDVSSSCITPSPKISPSAWIRSKTNELPDIKIKGKYRNLMSRMGRHRRHSSADFSYDPLSYSLNFEDSDHHDSSEAEEYFPMRSFAARLPSSPPPGGRSMLQRTPDHELPTTSRRAAAVAEVRKSLTLEETTPTPLQVNVAAADHQLRRSLDLELPTPRKVEEMGSRSFAVTEVRRSLDIPTPRKPTIRAPEATRRNDMTTMRRSLEDVSVSPALVVSPTSRQVLVELF